MSSIKDRIASAECVRGALVAEYRRFDESALRDKSHSLCVADREVIRLEALGVGADVRHVREALAVIQAAIDEAIRLKVEERLMRWNEAERRSHD